MNDGLRFRDRATCVVHRTPRIVRPCELLDLRGHFLVEHFRNGMKIGERKGYNLIVNQGRNRLLDVMFDAGTQITTWYIGLIDNQGVQAPALANVYANIRCQEVGGGISSDNGWEEFILNGYEIGGNNTKRGTWAPDPASGQIITNPSGSATTHKITATGNGRSVYGLFVVGGHTDCELQGNYSQAAGRLWAATAFSAVIPVTTNDELKVTYAVDANAA